MLDSQLIILVIAIITAASGLSMVGIIVVWACLRAQRNKKMNEALDVLRHMSGSSTRAADSVELVLEGNPEQAADALFDLQDHFRNQNRLLTKSLAILANGLSGKNRQRAIWHLIALATFGDSPEALLALRDHIPARDLRYALKTYWGGELRGLYRGEDCGLQNGSKLICFAMGTRVLPALADPLIDAEHRMLQERFGIEQEIGELEMPETTSDDRTEAIA